MLFASSPPVLFSFLLLLCGGVVLGDEVMINTPQELIDFSISVNSGNAYSGTTVYLGSDLDFTSDLSSSFDPIGNETYYFQGAFDGNGHAISNLSLTSPLPYAGLFGYSIGGIIKNVVLDASCSIVCSYDKKLVIGIGSIVGHCELCMIENVVNMASVAFIGNTNNYNIFLGGIVGRLLYSNTIRNCVSYGSVTHSGITSGSTYVGGIVGFCGGIDGVKFILNCANYGTITHNGTSSTLYMGGIVGSSSWGIVNAENCASAGKLLNLTSASGSNAIGGVVGYINSATTITHCLWTFDVGCVSAYDHGGSGSVTDTNSYLTELNTTTMNEMNTYAEKNSTWNKWFILHLNGGRINSDINQETLIVTQKHFPDPVKEGRTFSFWCTDTECTGKYDSETTSITKITDLYAIYTSFVTFDFGNGTKVTKVVTYGEKYGELPEVDEKEGYTFNGWFTEENGNGEEISSDTTVSVINDHTLYAHWTVNNYTLTFIFNNGESDEVRILDYNSTFLYPNDPVREGYTFNGWDNKDITTMPAYNLNITPQWIANNYTLTFIFNNGQSDDVKILNYSDTINYPNDPIKEGYTFNGWNVNITTMPAHNLNITALWTINNYTLTFIFDNGESDEIRILNYSDPIVYPNEPVREGYTFNGWNKNITTMPSHNINITALWTINKTTNSTSGFVEIVFSKKDLKEENVKEIIKGYTDETFSIEKIEVDEETGGTKVIIKFVDKEVAENFVETIKATSNSLVKNVMIIVNITDPITSFSTSFYPVSLVLFFLLSMILFNEV